MREPDLTAPQWGTIAAIVRDERENLAQLRPMQAVEAVRGLYCSREGIEFPPRWFSERAVATILRAQGLLP